MKRQHLIIGTISSLLALSHIASTQENVGIGTLTPSSRLEVQGNPTSTQSILLYSKVNYLGTLDLKAVEGSSITADGYGIGGRFVGGYKGLDILGAGGTYNGIMYGTYSNATGTTGTRVGVYGTSSGGTTNRGVHGYVNGGANFAGLYGENPNLGGHAGYFNGRGHFTHELRADRNFIVDDTAWMNRIFTSAGALNVRSASDIELTIDRNNTGVFAYLEVFNGAGSPLFNISESANAHSYGNMTVTNSVGIGTTVPASKLHILGGTDASLTTNGYAQFGPAGSWNLVIDDNEIMARSNGAANDLLLQQDVGNVLMCGVGQGRVGIGVQLANDLGTGYLLSVDGKIIAEEMRIQNSTAWPDYVFAKEYDLMSLDELKAAIAVQHHLPNIPPASEVERDGILVGDMQTRMMQKIEELTLYILQLHENNKSLQMQIDELRAAVSTSSDK